MDDWNYDGPAQAGRMEDNIPGVQDAGLASWEWKNSSRGRGWHWVPRRGGIDEVLLDRAASGGLPAFQDPCLASDGVDHFLQMCGPGYGGKERRSPCSYTRGV